MPSVSKIEEKFSGKFLRFFNVFNKHEEKIIGPYELASRRKINHLVANGNVISDAVVVLAKNYNSIVVIKEYRYGIGNWIWALPAGILEPNETEIECAVKELHEETGLNLIDPVVVRDKILSSPGLTDETISLVIGGFKGKLSEEHQEENELIHPFIVDLGQIHKLIKKEDLVSTRLAFVIEMFKLFKSI